jgi:signal transduction histidine kinase
MTAAALMKSRTCPPRHVLVVDDSEAEREILALTLEAAFPGITVSHTANPLLARAMCERQAFDCVLLDYNMPELDGLTLAAELRAAFAHLPIILLTSVGDEMLAAEALRGGVSDYLPKARVSPYSIRRTVDRSILACGQERVIQEQKAELENFAYALAHDFKQPIRQIITFAQLVDEQVGDGDAGVRQHLTFLGDAAGRLARLVDVMTQYTLLNQPPSLGEVDLNVVVASVRAALAPYLAERGGSFVAPEQAPTVWGNEVLMTQVLQNLVFNGLHYNQSPTPRVELTLEGADESWILEIQDNGVGIEPQYLGEIFKPLVRLHNASEYAGTGLGLTLARKAILAQKGDIWCESTPGIGSVFRVRAPRTRRQHAATSGDALQAAAESPPMAA